MALTTAQLDNMRTAIKNLSEIYGTMNGEVKKMDRAMSDLDKVWKGESAAKHRSAYQAHAKDITNLAEAVNSCSKALQKTIEYYNKLNANTSEIIKGKMGRRG